MASNAGATTTPGGHADGATRRDFLLIAAGAFGAVGAAATIWPFISQMNPSADVLALSSTEVDLTKVAVGQSVTVLWRGKPVFIRHRTADEISKAKADDAAPMPDPEPDAKRVQKPEWLVMIGVCTHLGCIPLGEQGEYGGWFCPCHGSQYDTSGRIRKGPAPANLAIPQYSFLSDSRVKIG